MCDDEYARVAHDLVDIAINRALALLTDSDWCNVPLDEYIVPADVKCRMPAKKTVSVKTVSMKTVSVEDQAEPQPNVSWPTIEEFTPDLGTERILEFIKTWEYDDNWLYCIDLISMDNLQYDTRYRYRLRWSIPTRRLPVPRFTASVYFTITISKIKPKDYPIDVFYVFEGNRLIHRPGRSRFEEKWLKDIIDNKMAVISNIDF